MSDKGPFIDYLCIVLVALGIVALGAEALVREQQSRSGKEGAAIAIAEFREDLSSRLAEGAAADEVAPQSEDERKARYPWHQHMEAEASTDEPPWHRRFQKRITEFFMGSEVGR